MASDEHMGGVSKSIMKELDILILYFYVTQSSQMKCVCICVCQGTRLGVFKDMHKIDLNYLSFRESYTKPKSIHQVTSMHIIYTDINSSPSSVITKDKKL